MPYKLNPNRCHRVTQVNKIVDGEEIILFMPTKDIELLESIPEMSAGAKRFMKLPEDPESY